MSSIPLIAEKLLLGEVISKKGNQLRGFHLKSGICLCSYWVWGIELRCALWFACTSWDEASWGHCRFANKNARGGLVLTVSPIPPWKDKMGHLMGSKAWRETRRSLSPCNWILWTHQLMIIEVVWILGPPSKGTDKVQQFEVCWAACFIISVQSPGLQKSIWKEV